MTARQISKRLQEAEHQLDQAVANSLALDASGIRQSLETAAALLSSVDVSSLRQTDRPGVQKQLEHLAACTASAHTLVDSAAALRFGTFLWTGGGFGISG